MHRVINSFLKLARKLGIPNHTPETLAWTYGQIWRVINQYDKCFGNTSMNIRNSYLEVLDALDIIEEHLWQQPLDRETQNLIDAMIGAQQDLTQTLAFVRATEAVDPWSRFHPNRLLLGEPVLGDRRCKLISINSSDSIEMRSISQYGEKYKELWRRFCERNQI